MTEEEFLKRWIMHYIHPEYFYIPFGDYMKLIEKIAYKNGVYLPKDEIDPETGKKYSPPAQGYSKFTVALPLDSKEVQITTSGIEESQAGIFIYDPHDEEPELEGYSLFTIDLSGVKDDIEDLQQQVSDLEDELEACHDCWEEVVAALQQYDPDYDPDESECPANKVEEVVDKEKELEKQVEECDQCKADVIAKLQEYDPNFDPVTCEDIVDEIDDVYQKGRDDEEDENPPGFDLPDGVDITDILPILDKDDIVTPEGNSYSFSYYVFENIEQKRYPVNYKFEPMVEGKRFQLHGFCEIIDNSTGTVVSAPGITGTIDISLNSDISWQIIKNEIDYTAKELVTTTHFRDGTYETDWVVRNNILLYLDTTSPNPRYNVRNG